MLVKGSDYTVDQVVGGDLVQGWGGKVVLVTLREGHSTTGTIRRMTAQSVQRKGRALTRANKCGQHQIS